MQVGDWVWFTQIVVRTKEGSGSAPAVRPLARRRRGMVIGVRRGFTAIGGSPPQLVPAEDVVLVAVALGRAYRVRHADLLPASAPRRRARRVPGAAGAS